MNETQDESLKQSEIKEGHTFTRSESWAKQRHYVPLEVRQTNYELVRRRIFGQDVGKKNIPKRILKIRQKAIEKRRVKRAVVETITRAETSFKDPRPFAKIYIKGKVLEGLLDTGASISLLGKGCRELLEELSIEMKPVFTNIRTASGRRHRIIGKIEINVEFDGSINNMELYLCPDLDLNLYLGIDFWHKFNLAPGIIPVEEINIETVFEEYRETGTEHRLKPHQLTEQQKLKLNQAIEEFDTFEKMGLGRTKLEKHVIKLVEGAVPFKDRHYPMSPAVQQITYEEIDKMLKLNVIEESESPWCNRTTVVRKPGKNRFCLDARKLNKLTEKDAYPLQNIDGILSRIDETYYISSVDLKFAFWQIELEEESKKYTAFTVPGRPLYQFRVMPFGLCNAAQRLCRLMDKVVPNRLKENVFIYLDDLLLISSDFEQHMELLKEVAQCLKAANLTIGLKKSQFCFRELKYLGYIIGDGMLKTDPDKVEAIMKIAVPKNIREVRSFLGTAGWYRRFIKDFATISAPLTDTLKKSKKFIMTEEAIKAFESLKRSLTRAPVLRHADFRKRFFIQCDASEYGIGAVLFQLNDQEDEHPIAFYSQKLNSSQKNYSVTEKECLAAVMAIKKFRPYVELMDFTVITDHASLQWLMNLKDLSGRLARWSLQLQAYRFDIVHRKGKDNLVADTLSRLPWIEEIDIEQIFEVNTNEFDSEEYRDLKNVIENNQNRLPDLKVEDNLVLKRLRQENCEFLGEYEWRIWVPEHLTHHLIQKAHDSPTSAHGGTRKTLSRLRQQFYWPNMTSQVRQYVGKCITCKETKSVNYNTKTTLGNEVKTERPFQKIYIDFLGKYPRSKCGNAYIFIVVDHFSKFVCLKAMREATASNVIRFLVEEIFRKFGVPETVHSDNGAQFNSKQFKDMIKVYQINHLQTAPYSPQSNASERVNQSVLAAIRAYLENDHRDWDLYLSEIECALRTSVHAATGVSPFFALFGYHMYTKGSDYKLATKLKSLTEHEILHLDRNDRLMLIRDKIKQNMHKAYEASAQRYNPRARLTKFAPGQEVYRRNYLLSDFQKNFNAKFARKFRKCRIVKPVGNNMYELEDLQGKSLGVAHAKDIKM